MQNHDIDQAKPAQHIINKRCDKATNTIICMFRHDGRCIGTILSRFLEMKYTSMVHGTA